MLFDRSAMVEPDASQAATPAEVRTSNVADWIIEEAIEPRQRLRRRFLGDIVAGLDRAADDAG